MAQPGGEGKRTLPDGQQKQTPEPVSKPYEMRRLSYAGTFRSPVKANTIRTIEWMTGKLTLLRLIRQFERRAIEPDRAKAIAAALGSPPPRVHDLPPHLRPDPLAPARRIAAEWGVAVNGLERDEAEGGR